MFVLGLQAPPNTISYLIIGYAIIGGIGLLYALSLLLRQRSLKRDLDVIERLYFDDDES
jgi:hypothetical protein